MPSCKEVATAVSSGEIESAGLFRRLTIRLHQWLCEPCRTYVRQIGLLGDAARRALAHEGADDPGLGRLEEQLIDRCGQASADAKSDPKQC